VVNSLGVSGKARPAVPIDLAGYALVLVTPEMLAKPNGMALYGVSC
jgi:hypothetical protein